MGKSPAPSTAAKVPLVGPRPAAPIAEIYGTRYALADADAL